MGGRSLKAQRAAVDHGGGGNRPFSGGALPLALAPGGLLIARVAPMAREYLLQRCSKRVTF